MQIAECATKRRSPFDIGVKMTDTRHHRGDAFLLSSELPTVSWALDLALYTDDLCL